ncbi:hydroxyisourate hydrolase [Polymorphobacter fuscus]|uniref:hydroxyisourate hydrolase n=1 Tax=Sandarakinorhabdus fusca TaxID=1439888 RepID=UPI001FB0C48B|nr:hydroxyisourate hydrolase [Polymorphobacter fuscus]
MTASAPLRPAADNQGGSSVDLAIAPAFDVSDPTGHYHVPVVASPHGYSTYRGN